MAIVVKGFAVHGPNTGRDIVVFLQTPVHISPRAVRQGTLLSGDSPVENVDGFFSIHSDGERIALAQSTCPILRPGIRPYRLRRPLSI